MLKQSFFALTILGLIAGGSWLIVGPMMVQGDLSAALPVPVADISDVKPQPAFVEPVQNLSASHADLNIWIEELRSAGWSRQAAEAVIALNQDTLFVNFAVDETLGRQALNVLKILGHRDYAVLMPLLARRPETAGLLAQAPDPLALARLLKHPSCYDALADLFMIVSVSPDSVERLRVALDRYNDTFCSIARDGLQEKLSIGIQLYELADADSDPAFERWMREALSNLRRMDDRIRSDYLAYVFSATPSIRERLRTDTEFASRFRLELWPTFKRIADGKACAELIANDGHGASCYTIYDRLPEVWDVLMLPSGDKLLETWGLVAINLLFGPDSDLYAHQRELLAAILLDGDQNTAIGLTRLAPEFLFRELLAQPLTSWDRARLVNRIKQDAESRCGNDWPPCNALDERLRYYTGLDVDVLRKELGPPPSERPETWIPLVGSIYAIGKLMDGRELDSGDYMNIASDLLFMVPVAKGMKPVAKINKIKVIAKPVKAEVKATLKFGNRAQALSDYFQRVKKIDFSQLPKGTNLEITGAVQDIFRLAGPNSRQMLQVMVGKNARFYMRSDARILVDLSHIQGLAAKETVTNAVVNTAINKSLEEYSAWQENAADWWLVSPTTARSY